VTARSRTRRLLTGSVIASYFLVSQQAFSVPWEVQAERLQLVSASFLDAQPLLSHATGPGDSFRVEAKAVLTVLPAMNATVGAKTEQPPQPPAHSIPTLEIGYVTKRGPMGHGILRLWGGFLPGDASKQIGMSASVGQQTVGLSAGVAREHLGVLSASLEMGRQWNQSSVEGGITDIHANDKFDVKGYLSFLTLTLSPDFFDAFWMQAQLTERDIYTRFEIPADGTIFSLRDRSSVRQGNSASQFSFGYQTNWGVQAAVSYLNVPQRSTTPRFLISYSKRIGFERRFWASNSF